MPTKRYYIAYGSNLNLKEMAARCPSAHLTGTATIKDYQLLFKGTPPRVYLTVEPKPGSQVPIALWEISARDELALDDYEDYPALYYKTEMELAVQTKAASSPILLSGLIYIMYETAPCGLPTPDYLEACREGYHDQGFDQTIIDLALVQSS